MSTSLVYPIKKAFFQKKIFAECLTGLAIERPLLYLPTPPLGRPQNFLDLFENSKIKWLQEKKNKQTRDKEKKRKGHPCKTKNNENRIQIDSKHRKKCIDNFWPFIQFLYCVCGSQLIYICTWLLRRHTIWAVPFAFLGVCAASSPSVPLEVELLLATLRLVFVVVFLVVSVETINPGKLWKLV